MRSFSFFKKTFINKYYINILAFVNLEFYTRPYECNVYLHKILAKLNKNTE